MNTITLTDTNFSKGIEVTNAPVSSYIGLKSTSSFSLSVTAEGKNYEDVSVTLYAHNSKSAPYNEKMVNVWKDLKPMWRFLYTGEEEQHISETAIISYHTELIFEDEVVGAIGTLEFYYIDDLSTDYGVPVLLLATLDVTLMHDRELLLENVRTPGYYNSKVTAVIPYYILPLAPSFLHVSQNGNLDLHSQQWIGGEIPMYATIRGLPEDASLSYGSGNIKSYPILFDHPRLELSTLDYYLAGMTNTEGFVDFPIFERRSGISDGGWAKFSIIPENTTDNTIVIANMDILYDLGEIDNNQTQVNDIWVSNPTSNKLHKIQSTFINSSDPRISEILKTINVRVVNNTLNTFIDVDTYEDLSDNPAHLDDDNRMELNYYSGIHAIAKKPNNQIWTLDFELDKVQLRTDTGTIIKEINLQTEYTLAVPDPLEEYSWHGPNSITLNSTQDAAISLWNTGSIIKINSDMTSSVLLSPSSISLTGDDEESAMHPIKAMFDGEDNLHVAYTSNKEARVIQFIPTAGGYGEWCHFDLTGDYEPRDFIIHHHHDFQAFEASLKYDLVFCIEGSAEDNGGIYKLSQTTYDTVSKTPQEYGSSLTKIVSCDNPYCITIDNNENVWFAYDNNKIGKLESLEPTTLDSTFSISIPNDGIEGEELIGGIGVDKSGYINIIDSYNNRIYRWLSIIEDDDIIGSISYMDIYPHSDQVIVNDVLDDLPSYVEGTPPSLKAYSDWTGSIYDYTFEGGFQSSLSNIVSAHLRGSSGPFRISKPENEYEMRRFNDSWDMTKQIKSYVLPEYQSEFVSLWDDLVGTIVGESGSVYQTLGRQFYEKISNFVKNHAASELSYVDALESNFKSIGIEFDTYDINYPAELKHWIDITSIPFQKLKGNKFRCNRNFTSVARETLDPCSVCGEVHKSNLGPELDVKTYYMKKGTPLVIKDTFVSRNGFDIFYPMADGDMSQLSEYGFRDPFKDEYRIYEYINHGYDNDNEQVEGHINWDDEYNVIDIESETYDGWTKPQGTLEKIFTNILTEHVGLMPDPNLFPNAVDELGVTLNILPTIIPEDHIITDSRVVFDSLYNIGESPHFQRLDYGILIYKSDVVPNEGAGELSLYDIETPRIRDTGKFLQFKSDSGRNIYTPVYPKPSLLAVYGQDSITLNLDDIVDINLRIKMVGYWGLKNKTGGSYMIPLYSA